MQTLINDNINDNAVNLNFESWLAHQAQGWSSKPQQAMFQNLNWLVSKIEGLRSLPVPCTFELNRGVLMVKWGDEAWGYHEAPWFYIIVTEHSLSVCSYFFTHDVWLPDWLPRPYDLAPIAEFFRQHSPVSLTSVMTTVPVQFAINDPIYLTDVEKVSILDDFGLSLDVLDSYLNPTYYVDDGTKESWLQTSTTDYSEALDEAMHALKARCYLPTAYAEISDYSHLDESTHNYLQQQIVEHGVTTAKAIGSIYELFSYLESTLESSLLMPDRILIDKNVMTYTINWDNVRVIIGLSGTILYQKGDELIKLSMGGIQMDKVAHAIDAVAKAKLDQLVQHATA